MTPEMKIESKETFSPIVFIKSFTEVDEAIERANASEYGFGALVFGNQGVSRKEVENVLGSFQLLIVPIQQKSNHVIT